MSPFGKAAYIKDPGAELDKLYSFEIDEELDNFEDLKKPKVEENIKKRQEDQQLLENIAEKKRDSVLGICNPKRQSYFGQMKKKVQTQNQPKILTEIKSLRKINKSSRRLSLSPIKRQLSRSPTNDLKLGGMSQLRTQLENLNLMAEYTQELIKHPLEENFQNDKMISAWLEFILDQFAAEGPTPSDYPSSTKSFKNSNSEEMNQTTFNFTNLEKEKESDKKENFKGKKFFMKSRTSNTENIEKSATNLYDNNLNNENNFKSFFTEFHSLTCTRLNILKILRVSLLLSDFRKKTSKPYKKRSTKPKKNQWEASFFYRRAFSKNKPTFIRKSFRRENRFKKITKVPKTECKESKL